MPILDRLRHLLTAPDSAATAARLAELAEAQAAWADRLEEVLREVGKLGREQFRTTTLIEAQSALLDDWAAEWRDRHDQRERETEAFRRALAELEERIRLNLVQEILPVGDGLKESIQAARTLRAALAAEPAPSPPARLGWLWGPRPALRPAATSRGALLDAWLDGLLLVERRLLGVLERAGVRPIPAVGEPFDPRCHQAVAVDRSGRVAAGTVVAEELRGYTVDGRILRHAEVVVARGTESEGL